MIIRISKNGILCVYDLPEEVNTIAEFESLISGYNYNEQNREELQGQPKLFGFCGPMFNGYTKIKGINAVIIRYEKLEKYNSYD